MVDEAAYREARSAAVPRACAYAKAILACRASCSHAVRRALADREAVGCASAAAHRDCADFLAASRERAAFALALRPGAPLGHAAAMKLQCGGLAALAAEADGAGAEVRDAWALVANALRRERAGEDLAWTSIVAAIARWAVRPRGQRVP